MSGLPEELAARYELRGPLGRGSYGAVVEVFDLRTQEVRALKRIPLTGDGRREMRELRAAAKVEHPHLLRSYETGVYQGQAFLVMERAEETLADVMEVADRRPEAWRLLREACRGVAALHRAGVVHRDLKPANILVVGGEARVADLGFAKGGDLETVTRTGMIQGTPQFMAPEQACGEPVGPEADVFALGLIVYWLWRERSPWSPTDPVEVLTEVATFEEIDVGVEPSSVGEEVLELVRSMLDREPGKRPRDLDEVGHVLGEWRTPEVRRRAAGTTARNRPVPSSSLGRRLRRHRGLVLSGWLGVLVLLGWLLPLGPGPAPSEGPGDPPVAPASSGERVGPERPPGLEAGLVGRVAEELAEAEELIVLEGGEVVPAPEGSLPAGSRGLLSRDPARWGELLGALPALQRAMRTLRDEPRPWALHPALRDELAEVDGLLARRRLPRVFAPWLLLTPPTQPEPDRAAALVEEAALESWRMAPAELLGPWALASLATARELQASWERYEREAERVAAGGEVPELGPELTSYLRRVHRLGGGDLGNLDPLRLPESYYHDERTRLEFEEWLDVDVLVRRWVIEVARSLREEGASRSAVALHSAARARELRGLWYGSLLDADLDLWVPVLPEDPDSSFFGAILHELRGRILRAHREDSRPEQARALEGFARAHRGPVENGSQAQRVLDALERGLAVLVPEGRVEEAQRWAGRVQSKLHEWQEHAYLHHVEPLVHALAAEPDARILLTAQQLERVRGILSRCEATREDHASVDLTRVRRALEELGARAGAEGR